MASSKSNLLLLLSALFTIFLIVSSEVAVSDDHTENHKETTGLEEAKHGDPGYGYLGGGYGSRGGYSGHGCYPRRGCRYRCDCPGYRYAPGCQKCCTAN